MGLLTIPDMALVVLVGASGSGKSTFARRCFAPTQVLSSDAFRAMVADDENDQSATTPAFDALHHVAGLRLTAGRVTVIDATNVQREARAPLVALAKAHHVLPVAIVLDVAEGLCHERNAARTDRDFGPHVLRRQCADLRRSLRGLAREGFRRVHVLRSPDEIDAATITVEPLLNDRRAETGPFDVIGDVHGCREELVELLTALGYAVTRDGAHHPDGRRAVFVGDLVDRGPDTPGVLRLVMGMVADGDAFCVCGNHEQKLVRALNGRKVTIGHGLGQSLEQLAVETDEFREQVRAFCDGLVAHYVLDGGKLVVAHAGLPERYHGRASGTVRSFALYGDTTGRRACPDPDDHERIAARCRPWPPMRRGRAGAGRDPGAGAPRTPHHEHPTASAPARARARSHACVPLHHAPVRAERVAGEYETGVPDQAAGEPAAVQAIAATRIISPRAAANPASGRNTSLGSGGNTFSSDGQPTPGAPSASISSTTESMITHPMMGSCDAARSGVISGGRVRLSAHRSSGRWGQELATGAGGPGQPEVEGEQRGVEELGERHEAGVVVGAGVAELPRSFCQGRMRPQFRSHVHQVAVGECDVRGVDHTGSGPSAQHVAHLERHDRGRDRLRAQDLHRRPVGRRS